MSQYRSRSRTKMKDYRYSKRNKYRKRKSPRTLDNGYLGDDSNRIGYNDNGRYSNHRKPNGYCKHRNSYYNDRYHSHHSHHSHHSSHYHNNHNNHNNNNHNPNHHPSHHPNHHPNHHQQKQDDSFSDPDSEHLNDDDDDLEGTVNLKDLTSIYRKRYHIKGKLGKGTFGSVIECFDNKRNMCVAMKIVRSVKRYLDAAQIEIEILNKLDECDVNRNSLVIRLYKSFVTEINGKQHSCMVFQKCGRSILDFIKKNKYHGFQLSAIAMIAYQLFHSISFCHFHKLTHTDLKLENILFISSDHSVYRDRESGHKFYFPTSFEIRLIDFGGATFEKDHHSSIINTRQYRGPEVILGLSWSYPSDIWSLGCILSELYCGELLFGTHEDSEHLALMTRILNRPFPRNMCNDHNNLFNVSNAKSVRYVEKTKKLEQIIGNHDLCNLIRQCLQIDPQMRITAQVAKNHRFFKKYRNDNEFNKIYNKLQ